MVNIPQLNLTGGIVSEGMYARSDTTKYQQGVRDAQNMVIKPQGGMENRAGLETVTGFDTSGATDNQFLIPFQYSVDDAYQIEFTDSVFRVIRDGGYVLDSSVAEASVDSVTSDDPAEIELTDSARAADFPIGSLVYLSDPNGDHALHNTFLRVTLATGALLEFEVYDSTHLDTTTVDWGATGAGATLQLVYQEAHPYTLSDLPKVNFAQDGNAMFLVHELYAVRQLTRTDHDDWTLDLVDFTSTITAPTGGSATATLGTGATASETYNYVVSAVAEDTFDESLPSTSFSADNELEVQGSYNDLSWTAVAGAERYNVYREYAGAYGYIGSTTAITFRDQNIGPDTSSGPRIERDPFNAAGEYPAVVGFYEQRLVFGRTVNDPQLMEFSRTANATNFDYSFPDQPDDAFRFRLRAQQVNGVLAFIPHQTFTILTGAAAWEIAPQGDGEYIRPDKRRFNPSVFYGSAELTPLVLGEVALYVEPSGNAVRDMRLRQRTEPPGDLTILCRDLFDRREIVSWAYAHAPSRAVWAVLDDGALLTLTYIPEHDVWGWTRQAGGGTDVAFKQVSVIHENRRDVPYFVVSRTINGSTVTLTERLADRRDDDVTAAYFVDAGFCAEFVEAVGEVRGLLHLRGETVTAVVDGDELTDLVVDETGTVDLGDKTGTVVCVGLPYTAFVETLEPVFQMDGLGSSIGRFKAASEVAIHLEKTRGVAVGRNLEDLNELKEWSASLIGGPLPLVTDVHRVTYDGDWDEDPSIFIVQEHALPITLNGITPDWEPGE